MSRAWLIALLMGMYVIGAAVLASAYSFAWDFAPAYFALYLVGMSLIGLGTHFVVRRLRNLSTIPSTAARTSA